MLRADPHESLNSHTLSKYIGMHEIDNVIQTSGMNKVAPRLSGRHSTDGQTSGL